MYKKATEEAANAVANAAAESAPAEPGEPGEPAVMEPDNVESKSLNKDAYAAFKE